MKRLHSRLLKLAASIAEQRDSYDTAKSLGIVLASEILKAADQFPNTKRKEFCQRAVRELFKELERQSYSKRFPKRPVDLFGRLPSNI